MTKSAMSQKPRIKVHRDGTCTLTGVPVEILQSLFTQAALYQYDQRGKVAAERAADEAKALEYEQAGDWLGPIVRRNIATAERWHEVMKQTLSDIHGAFTESARRGRW